MNTKPNQPDLLPTDPTGQRLCEIFGRYRWKFIQAEAPADATAKPQWKTERRYPIKNRVLWRQWQDANELVGVRFSDQTIYALLDIDITSPYHPRQDADSLSIIQAALETIGITRTVPIRSSWSGGLHVYIPVSEAVNTFNFSVALKQCLEAQGFKVKAGQLEIFPNDKAYGVTHKIEYRAHRLPLQPGSGSHLLDADLNPISSQLSSFFAAWDIAAAGQDLPTLQSALSIARENRYKRIKPRKLSNVEAWRADLETTLAEGWTGHGQTNHLLKEIGCYGVVFQALSGEALVNYIHQQALASPGYQQWCRHQHQIRMRSRVWARAVENYYWPLGSHPKPRPEQNNIVPFNQRRAAAAQERISAAVTQLEADQQLPEQTTQRAAALSALAETSLSTLYQYKALWHPEEYQPVERSVINDIASDIAPVEALQAESQNQREPLPRGELHTEEKIMKCKPAQLDFSFPEKTKKTSFRGVRGETKSFPQKRARALPPVAPPSLPRPQLSLELIPREPHIDSDLDEVIRAIQARVRSLNWSIEEVSQFIADRFEGRRRYQLRDDELLLLLYYLQDVGQTGERPNPQP